MRSHISVGFGPDLSSKDLAGSIGQVGRYQRKITFDLTKPDGTPKKLMSSHRIGKMGWRPKVSLIDGIKITYQDFLK